MEKHIEISWHQVAIWGVLKRNPGVWMTNKQIEKMAHNVCARTLRHHTTKMVEMGLIDMADVFPGPRYRYSEEKAQRNAFYVERLKEAEVVFANSMR